MLSRHLTFYSAMAFLSFLFFEDFEELNCIKWNVTIYFYSSGEVNVDIFTSVLRHVIKSTIKYNWESWDTKKNADDHILKSQFSAQLNNLKNSYDGSSTSQGILEYLIPRLYWD